MRSITPNPERLVEFMNQIPADRPIVMLNLLRYREQAEYPAGFDAAPCTGQEAYQRYGAVAAQRIVTVGGRLVWAGKAEFSLIAPDDEAWDSVILVEYPSAQAFAEMLAQPEYLAVAPHRTAALADSRLVATQAQANPLGL